MKSDRKEFLKTYGSVRKTMPKPEKVIMPKKERYERSSWRYDSEEDNREDYKGYRDLDNMNKKE